MIRDLVRGALGAVAVLALAGLLGGGASAGGDKKVYKNPQEVFDAAKKALQQDDIKTFAACLTEDSRDGLAGGLLLVGFFMKGFTEKFGKEEDKEKLKKLDAVLARHGITEDFIKTLPKPELKAPDQKPDRAETLKMVRKILAPVKDRDAFLADMLSLMPKDGKRKGGLLDKLGPNPVLANVKIEGEKAKGEIVGMKDGMEVRESVEFRKEAGSWKIDLPLDLGGKGPKGPPGGGTSGQVTPQLSAG
jgi:hypothetical protein